MAWASEDGFAQVAHDRGQNYTTAAAWRARYMTKGLENLGTLLAELMKARR